MASFAAARSIFRSSAARNAAARLASQSKSKPKASPFSLNSTANKPIFRRSPVEMSFAVESMMPYHTVTASALMTSMLSISRRSCGWLPEGGVVELGLGLAMMMCDELSEDPSKFYYKILLLEVLIELLKRPVGYSELLKPR
ncbi:unnamed protein product [Dovyalis caffra]|uniref:Protein NUCLEAR FUSION DEFECTIVE 6, chloroplastic/mitochondrial-like n=1 Tax=Dovyalis caffra TaxID=77055 RepID=A0AAV1QPG4_9ROSI|nr:unnamed protein product [Dovyalis caffra]